MPVRNFDGVNDNITLALGSLGFAFGPGTIVAILRKADDLGTENVVYVGISGTTARYALLFSTTVPRLRCGVTEINAPASITVTAAEGWVLIAAAKATGTSAVRFHKYVFGTATWVHDDGTTVANSAVPTTNAFIGSTHTPSSFFHGDLGIAGVWSSVLTDGQIEALVIEEQEWIDAAPAALWPTAEFGDDTTTLLDTIGAADESARTGTSAVADDVPWTGTAITYTLDPATTTDEAQPLDYWVDTPIEITLTPATTTDEAQALTYGVETNITLTPATTLDQAQSLSYRVQIVRETVPGDPRPDLRLYGEIETRSGMVRLDPDHPDPAYRLAGARFGTRLMEGFTTASVSVARDIRRPWPDLRLNGTFRLVGEAARVAYEGRMLRFPAQNDEGHRIGIEAVSWLTHARDRKRTYDPAGLTGSEAIIQSAAAFCPLLDTFGVDASSVIVTQEPWTDLTDPLDMWLGLNAEEVRQLAVWENRRLVWTVLDMEREDWVVRLDEGARVAFDGPSVEGLATGVQVEYDDVDTSTREVLTPETNPSLAVTDPDIIDRLDGLSIVPTITLSRGNTAAGAERIGVAVLSDLMRPKNPCRLTVRGHIRDSAGNWQQGWLARAGQSVVLEDYDASPPRLIHETAWDQETLTLTMDLDADSKTMDALIAQAGG